jgi:haloalkane dehalogenase
MAWLLHFQQRIFQDALLEHQRAHFGSFLAPIINDGFLQQPSSGLAFAQVAAQLLEEVSRNAKRLPEMEALDIPVKIVWGKNDPYLTADVAEDFRSHLKRSSLHLIPAGHWGDWSG